MPISYDLIGQIWCDFLSCIISNSVHQKQECHLKCAIGLARFAMLILIATFIHFYSHV